MSEYPYRYVAIEGNIGAGKTTLCHMLAKDLGCRLLLEQFTDNPFLPPFYQNPERFAFPVELFFMTERYKQMEACFAQPDLFSSFVLSDYFFIKTLLFASNNLQDDEFRLFQNLFQLLNQKIPRPDLLVYVHRPVESLLQNIEKRARNFETEISADYLQTVQKGYLDYFRICEDLDVLIIDVGDVNFLEDSKAYAKMRQLLLTPGHTGINHLNLNHI